MITEDLIAYIQSQAKKNISRDEIASRLAEAGWHDDDIKEALDKIITAAPVAAPALDISPDKIEEPKKEFDPYRELPEIAKIDVATPITGKTESPKIELPKTESPKVWTPMAVKPQPDKVILAGKVVEPPPVINANPQAVKVETPIANQPAIKKEIPVISVKNNLEIRNEEISSPQKTASEIPPLPASPAIPPAPSMITKPAMSEMKIKSEAPPPDNLPKIAMTASYAQDVLSASKTEKESNQNRKKIFVKLLIIIAAIIVMGGTFFAFVEGYIKIPVFKINLLLVKKDPKGLLLNTSIALRALKSYKIETSATISSP